MNGLRDVSIDHLGIAVASIDEVLPVYQALVGNSEPIEPEVVPAEKVRVAMVPVEGSRVELLEATSSESVIASFVSKRGPGLHHVAFRVNDLEAAISRMKSQGARVLSEPKIGAGGHRYVFIHPASTGGVLIELVQEQGS